MVSSGTIKSISVQLRMIPGSVQLVDCFVECERTSSFFFKYWFYLIHKCEVLKRKEINLKHCCPEYSLALTGKVWGQDGSQGEEKKQGSCFPHFL